MTLLRLAGAPPAALPLGLALALGGCIAGLALPDPEAARLARTVRDDARDLYGAMAQAAAPDCSYEQNQTMYLTLADDANRLAVHLAAGPGRPGLRRAAEALARTVAAARESHRLASLGQADPAGACLAPDVLNLNLAAIVRASSAIEVAASPGVSAPAGAPR